MEKIKPLCAKEFLAASHQSIEEKKIESNIGAVKKCDDMIPTNKYDDETLVWMMLLDGCFILEFILLEREGTTKEVLREHQIGFVQEDLFLLENQLPFGVLELIFKEEKLSIKEFVTAYIGRLEGTLVSEMQLEKPAHLLDLLRSALLGGGSGDKKSSSPNKRSRKLIMPVAAATGG